MKHPKSEFWGSRLALILAGLGMAVGCGNIWRFPRIAAKYGGSTFIIATFIALLIWSVPILVMEMAMGRNTRKGPIGAFHDFLGARHTWMGAWIACVTLGITFYYSVVAGWCIKYVLLFIQGLPSQDSVSIWNSFTQGYQPLIFHFLALVIGSWIIWSGVNNGIERINKIFIPLLFLLLGFLAYRAITLPGGKAGADYLLFRFQMEHLTNPVLWLEAFSQSAWSTGAGWGLWLTYAIYSKDDENMVSNSTIVGIGDTLASVMAGLVIIPVVFATIPSTDMRREILEKADNQGLTFNHLVNLFDNFPGGGGRWVGLIFFIVLFLAALTSLIAMLEMGTRLLMDTGMSRKKAVVHLGLIVAVLGAPSALSLQFFNNQDWVWGLGLLVSGFLVAMAAWIKDTDWIRDKYIGDSILGSLWKFCIRWCIPFAFLALLSWWLILPAKDSWERVMWWDPRGLYTPANVLCQWGFLLLVVILANRYLGSIFGKEETSKNSAQGQTSRNGQTSRSNPKEKKK